MRVQKVLPRQKKSAFESLIKQLKQKKYIYAVISCSVLFVVFANKRCLQ